MYEKPKVNRIWFIILGVVALTIVLLGVLALLVNSMNKGEEASTGTTEQVTTEAEAAASEQVAAKTVNYTFRKKSYKDQHYEKHGKEMGFSDADSYEAAANEVVNDPSSLHKTEKEDGDDVYYREKDNAFVVVSTDGYIRTFFYPNGGKAYYDRQ